MKRLILIVILLVAGFLAYSQALYYNFDGIDWQRMTEKEKLAFVTGFQLGVENFIARMAFEYGESIPDDVEAVLKRHCFFFVWPEEIVEHIEAFYKEKENLREKLYNAIYAWNDEEEDEESDR